ncbi:hypothetical protein CALVIDRAFT_90927 [Calocera viscosa TUFC12733]|uniref:RNI-like protein n=1 Tax=Calocera viscosa (strain TUFC12733) TaxID=1330018 RepID=A0A167MSW6_CALVF|nr:hypothetical protein CALVIDRAFT_90927 [Calocera viscosa TUFC12733]
MDESLRLMQNLHTVASFRISNEILLPSLRVLQFRALSTDHISTAALFICPALDRVAGCCVVNDGIPPAHEWDMHTAGFLHKLQHNTPDLKEFEMYGFRESNVLSLPALMRLIEAVRLRSFESDFIALQPNVVRALGQSTTLTSLNLGDLGSDEDYVALERMMFSTCLQAKSFASLRSIDLETNSAVALPLLLAMRTVQLRNISIKLTEKTFSSAVFKTLFSFIPEFADTLVSCRVDVTETLEGEDEDEGTLEWTTFTPLYQCHNLRSFSCGIDSQADLELEFGDCDVQLLSQAWPELTSLAITWFTKASGAVANHESGLAFASSLTLLSFGYLAQNCPNLEDLEFSYVYARAPIPCPPVGFSASTKLSELHVGRSAIDCAVTVALYLRLLWPIATVYHDSTPTTDNEGGVNDQEDRDGPKWDEVGKMLSVMRYADVVGSNARVLSNGPTLSAVVSTIRNRW